MLKVSMPILPMNMVSVRIILHQILSSGVMPTPRPTVPKAENSSNTSILNWCCPPSKTSSMNIAILSQSTARMKML